MTRLKLHWNVVFFFKLVSILQIEISCIVDSNIMHCRLKYQALKIEIHSHSALSDKKYFLLSFFQKPWIFDPQNCRYRKVTLSWKIAKLGHLYWKTHSLTLSQAGSTNISHFLFGTIWKACTWNCLYPFSRNVRFFIRILLKNCNCLCDI